MNTIHVYQLYVTCITDIMFVARMRARIKLNN